MCHITQHCNMTPSHIRGRHHFLIILVYNMSILVFYLMNFGWGIILHNIVIWHRDHIRDRLFFWLFWYIIRPIWAYIWLLIAWFSNDNDDYSSWLRHLQYPVTPFLLIFVLVDRLSRAISQKNSLDLTSLRILPI